MRHFKVTFFFLAVALTLSSCGLFGGDDAAEVAVAEDVAAQPTVNSVQAVPAQTPADTAPADTAAPADSTGQDANAALPTAVTLPTAAPTPEPTVDRSQPTTYVVQSGDVLGLIAERFDADIAELRRVNSLDGNLIRVGQELTIPALDGSTATESDSETASESEAEPAATSAPASSGSSTSAATVSCNSTGSGHCVQPGESLLGIALKYDVTVESLRAANPGITGDLIKSGEVLNLSSGATTGGDASPAPTAVAGNPSAPVEPAATVGPTNDADCKARNAEFPYFHASDGLCYANPIGATVVATSAGSGDTDLSDKTCDPGFFLWEDGLCYPIPGATVVATAGPTPTNPPTSPIYGVPPCRDGYLEIPGRDICWPEPDTTPVLATATPVATSTASDNAALCVAPNFFLQGTTCFVEPAGAAIGCELEFGTKKPICPAT